MSLINAEIQRRSEEIDNAEVQYNKQWVVIKNQEKESDKKKGDFNELQKENEMIMLKNEKLNHFLQDEEENLTIGHK
jgi:hypothetical protein